MEIEQLKQLHEKTNGQDRELFIKQVLYFRKIMGSTKYTLKQKEKEFENVAYAYFRCNITEDDKTLFVALADEFQIRSGYELLQEVKGRNQKWE